MGKFEVKKSNQNSNTSLQGKMKYRPKGELDNCCGYFICGPNKYVRNEMFDLISGLKT